MILKPDLHPAKLSIEDTPYIYGLKFTSHTHLPWKLLEDTLQEMTEAK